ncbi:hypothetical protein J132_03334 [Termitomyces sp. J132]|nr:hypothetical protein J132_03334 [Termitomyces sp. J132]
MLTSCKTRLKFNNFISEPFDVLNGTTQGCLLAMLFYAFYNTPLIQVTCNTAKNELASGFVDNTMFLATAKTLAQCHAILNDMIHQPGRGFNWSTFHHSPFTLSKLALMNFPCSHLDAIPCNLSLSWANPDSTMTIQWVETVPTYKYLGVVVDHPLYSTICQTARHFVAWDHSPLHYLFHVTGVNPKTIEIVEPVRHCPNYSPSFSTLIAQDKNLASELAAATLATTPVAVYCNGSGFEDGIGTSAVLFVKGVEKQHLCYHLRSKSEHTIYEAEIMGILLALHLLMLLCNQLSALAMISSDSQATIKALVNQCPHPFHYLLNLTHTVVENLHRKQDHLICTSNHHKVLHSKTRWINCTYNIIDLQIHRTPSHVGFSPNKCTSELAKQASQRHSSISKSLPLSLCQPPLLVSISASCQAAITTIHSAWKVQWKRSP